MFWSASISNSLFSVKIKTNEDRNFCWTELWSYTISLSLRNMTRNTSMQCLSRCYWEYDSLYFEVSSLRRPSGKASSRLVQRSVMRLSCHWPVRTISTWTPVIGCVSLRHRANVWLMYTHHPEPLCMHFLDSLLESWFFSLPLFSLHSNIVTFYIYIF